MNYSDISILGATGVVGQTLVSLLSSDSGSLGIKKLRLFASEKSEGTFISYKGGPHPVLPLTPQSAKIPADLVFCCLGDDPASFYVPLFAKQGAVVIDNSSVFRLNKDIPLIVPEINGKELSELFSLSQSGSQNRREAGQAPINRTGKIISNPNCSTIQTAVCLAPLHRVFTLKEVYVCTYQAVSGAGAGALYDFDHPMLKPETLPFPICSNLIPFIGEIDASGSSREENKIRLEFKKILDCDIPVNAHTVRVPVRNCHGIAIFARFEKDPDIGEAVRILSEAPGVKLFTEGFPMPVNMQGEKSVGVGRIRKGESPNSLCLWTVADNLRKGAALNALQIAALICGND